MSYARARAEIQAESLRTNTDVEVVVRETHAEFEVRAHVESDLDVQALKRLPGPTLVEFFQSCYAKGVNPRVYHPGVPEGFEAEHGLDRFGRKE